MLMQLAIRLRGVVKRYGPITAVDGLDLDVPVGTCVGLLGPNGAGKSTTMRLLTAQSIADDGDLEVLGFKLPDEPTVGLDPQVRQEVWALIDALRTEGTTILMSTHYIEEAQRLCDTVLIMSHGRAVAAGPPRDLVIQHAGHEVIEVYGPPARLAEVEAEAGAAGMRTRRTGTSISILRADGGNGFQIDGERRRANLEDVFVLLTGEEIG